MEFTFGIGVSFYLFIVTELLRAFIADINCCEIWDEVKCYE